MRRTLIGLLSIIASFSACSSHRTLAPTMSRTVNLRNPYAVMLYGTTPYDMKAAYFDKRTKQLIVACALTEGDPQIEIDEMYTGAALWCGKQPLWHVEFTSAVPATTAPSHHSTTAQMLLSLPISGIAGM